MLKRPEKTCSSIVKAPCVAGILPEALALLDAAELSEGLLISIVVAFLLLVVTLLIVLALLFLVVTLLFTMRRSQPETEDANDTQAIPSESDGAVPLPGAVSPPPDVPATSAPSPQLTAQNPPTIPPKAETLLQKARLDAAQRAGVAASDVMVLVAEEVEWRDASLGCPDPGVMYAQVITPGYRFVFRVAGSTYNYHSDRFQHVIYCDRPQRS